MIYPNTNFAPRTRRLYTSSRAQSLTKKDSVSRTSLHLLGTSGGDDYVDTAVVLTGSSNTDGRWTLSLWGGCEGTWEGTWAEVRAQILNSGIIESYAIDPRPFA